MFKSVQTYSIIDQRKKQNGTQLVSATSHFWLMSAHKRKETKTCRGKEKHTNLFHRTFRYPLGFALKMEKNLSAGVEFLWQWWPVMSLYTFRAAIFHNGWGVCANYAWGAFLTVGWNTSRLTDLPGHQARNISDSGIMNLTAINTAHH